MPRKLPDHDSLPVMVPRNCKHLMPITSGRVQRLRQHLQNTLGDLGAVKDVHSTHMRPAPEPAGFSAVVARAACSLCKGDCCKNGADDAFLDGRTITGFRRANSSMTDDVLISLYVDRVPVEAYADSCIFHGWRGCTLDRSMRADVCNTYFCRGLSEYLRSPVPPESTVVIAGDSERTRVSQVLTPPRVSAEQG